MSVPPSNIEHMFEVPGPVEAGRPSAATANSESPLSQAAVVAALRSLPKGASWSDLADDLLVTGSALAVWDRLGSETLFGDPRHAAALVEAEALLSDWQRQGWRFLSILDGAYPSRLREIHQAPPFLFAAGQLVPDDVAIAVVGSRKASPDGLRIATDVATSLARNDITVLSGLAEGIDAAAHTAALAAGGRTVAFIGTGIAKHYPAKNAELQREVASRGLLLSQFWPDGPPQRHNFLMRNAVMSGYGHATVVVEAGEQSGARAQARMAVEHGRPVIVTDLVLRRNEWAQRLEGRPGVHVASSTMQVMDHVHSILEAGSHLKTLMQELVDSTK